MIKASTFIAPEQAIDETRRQDGEQDQGCRRGRGQTGAGSLDRLEQGDRCRSYSKSYCRDVDALNFQLLCNIKQRLAEALDRR